MYTITITKIMTATAGIGYAIEINGQLVQTIIVPTGETRTISFCF